MSRPKEKSARRRALLEPELRLKVNLRDNMLGPGKLRLLEQIDKLGSISAAAREMGIGYRRAWFLIETLQACFAEPLLSTSRGGGTQGGAKLTAAGHELLAHHREFEAKMQTTAAPFLGWLKQVEAKPEPS